MSDNAEPKLDDEDPGRGGSLVPLYSPLDVTRGIQAYRRGDIILYTVRGEPSKVQELIGELDRRGVSELVAHLSAQTPPSAEIVITARNRRWSRSLSRTSERSGEGPACKDGTPRRAQRK